MRNLLAKTILFTSIGGLLPCVGPAPADAQTVFEWTHFAGLPGTGIGGDGTGSGARFNYPSEVAVDGSGNVYVADTEQHTIRKVTPAGVVTTLAGSPEEWGEADGAGSAARFDSPLGVAVDAAGNVYVADTYNHTIRKVTPAGIVTTLAGSPGEWGSDDGVGAAARFDSPNAVAADAGGNLYVADRWNYTIRKVTPAGAVTTLAGSPGEWGSDDGVGAAARFGSPSGVAVDAAGNVYVADTYHHTIRKVTPAGAVTTLAGSPAERGSDDGIGAAARFDSPAGVGVDSVGNVYVADLDNHTIRKITPGGVVTTLAGNAGDPGDANGTVAAARFDSPGGVAVDGAGNLFVADSENHTIRKVTPAGVVSTLAGARAKGSADGVAEAARLNFPDGAAVDGSGNLYVADTVNHTIRKVTPAGVVSTLAGSPGIEGSADGVGIGARFAGPRGVAVDSFGNVLVADAGNETIRKITPAGVVTTLAGRPGEWGADDGVGDAARFDSPRGLAVDSVGNVYVADLYNHTIRKITPGGVVTTLAGSAGESGFVNGTGAAARFDLPSGVAVDGIGNVYVTDLLNNAIRKITPSGLVTTLAGSVGILSNTVGVDEFEGFPLLPTHLGGIVVDGAGSVYVADTESHTIRKLTPEGVVTTIGGSLGSPGNVDGVGSTSRFRRPTGLAVGSDGSLFVVDEENHRIRRVGSGAVPPVTVAPPVPTPPARAVVQRPRPFQTTLVGKKSRAQTLRISNLGGSPLGGLRVVAGGKAKRDFLLSQPIRKSLAPGASTTFKASFRPRAKGLRKAALTVRSSAPAVRAVVFGRASSQR